jgi:hypothetical protein
VLTCLVSGSGPVSGGQLLGEARSQLGVAALVMNGECETVIIFSIAEAHVLPLRPVAPEQAWRASNRTTEGLLAPRLGSESIW